MLPFLRRHHHGPKNRMTIFVIPTIALLAFLALACGPSTSNQPVASDAQSSVDVSPPPRTSTASTSALGPIEEARDQGVRNYRRMWAAYAAAAATSDWQSPEPGRYATGTALSTLTKALSDYQRQGVVTRGQPVLNPVVSAVEPAHSPVTVIVSDCGDSTNWTKHHAADGRPLEGDPGGRRHIDAVVEKQSDGSWKVTRFTVQAVGTC